MSCDVQRYEAEVIEHGRHERVQPAGGKVTDGIVGNQVAPTTSYERSYQTRQLVISPTISGCRIE